MQSAMSRFLKWTQDETPHIARSSSVDIEARLNASVMGQQLLLGESAIPIGEDPTSEVRGVTEGFMKGWVDEAGELQVSIFSRDIGEFTTLGSSLRTALDALQAEFDALTFNEVDGDLDVSGDLAVGGSLEVAGTAAFTGNVGFFGVTPAASQAIAGSRSTQTAAVLGGVLTLLEDFGLCIDQTTA